MRASTLAGKSLRFGSFELDVRSRELRSGAATRVRLQEQPFEILRMMLERPGDVVTREELQQRLWPGGTFVDFEHSLNAAVKRLRAALGDDADHPRFVETLPRRGYRFIGVLEADATEAETAAAGPIPRVRLAVLPFVNLSGDPGQEYFVDGLTDEMIAQLGQACRGRIAVIARTSSMRFKDSGMAAREIGEMLRANYLLEGGVRRERDRVRITARLVETSGETNLWVETYEAQLTDYLTVQKDVSARLARALSVELTPQRPAGTPPVSPDAAAYHAYLKGRYCWNMVGDSGVAQAVAHLEQATRLDPSFAAAHALLARNRTLRAEYYGAAPRDDLQAARHSVERALDLDPALLDAHLALGDLRRMLDWDWRGAETAYAQAITLNPNHEGAHRLYGVLLSALARPAEAIRETDLACELDPLCVVASASGAAWVRYLAGDYDDAIRRTRDAIEMEPRYLASHRILAAAYLASGRHRDAVTVLETVLATTDGNPPFLASLAHVSAVSGRREAAEELLNTLARLSDIRHVSAYYVALAHVGLENADAAFEALNRAAADHDPALAHVAVEPRFAPIRSDGRFQALVARLGLA